MKRVSLVSPYALSVFGGVQEQVLAMSRELARRDIDVQIIAPDATDQRAYDTPARLDRCGRVVRVAANGSRAPLTLSPLASRRAHEAVRDFGPDVVHFHEPFAPLIGWSTLRAHHTAAVGTFHRHGLGRDTTLAGPWLRRWAAHLDVTTAVSEAAAATAHAAYGMSATVLYNGFETERFRDFPRTRNDLPTFVVVGRHEPRKGTDVVVRAVVQHNARGGVPWRLVVIGDGAQTEALRGLADRHVEFLGAADDATKRRWWREADVALAPALYGESFGLVLLEAMAAETPVVASDIEGYRLAGAQWCTWVRPGEVDDWESAMAIALTTDAATRAGARAYAEQWSMAGLVDRYLTLYDEGRRRFRDLG